MVGRRGDLITDFVLVSDLTPVRSVLDTIAREEAGFVLAWGPTDWKVAVVDQTLVGVLEGLDEDIPLLSAIEGVIDRALFPHADAGSSGGRADLPVASDRMVVIEADGNVAGLVFSPELSMSHEALATQDLHGGLSPGPATDPVAEAVFAFSDATPVVDAPDLGDEGGLQWVTRMPRDPGAWRARTLVADRDYLVETSITAMLPAFGDPMTEVPEDIIGSTVEIVVEAEGLDLTELDSQVAGRRLVSPPSEVEPAGSRPFFFFVRSRSDVGTLTLSLRIDGRPYDVQQVIALGTGERGTPLGDPAPTPRAATRVGPVPAAPAPALTLTTGVEAGEGIEVIYEAQSQVPIPFRTRYAAPDARAAILAARSDLSAAALAYDRYRGEPPTSDPLDLPVSSAAMADLATIGRSLHRALFGDGPEDGMASVDTRSVAGLIRQAGRVGDAVPPGSRMCVEDFGLPIPWGVVYDADWGSDTAGGAVHPAGFWGYRFTIDRMVRRFNRGPLTRSLAPDVATTVIVNRSIDPPLLDAHGVRAIPDGVRLTTMLESGADVREWLRSPEEIDLLYIYCHASPAHAINPQGFFARIQADDQARLELGPDDVVSANDLGARPVERNPLVVLTACHGGAGDPAYTAPFASRFIRGWDCRSLLAADAEVPAEFGIRFTRRVLDRFLATPETQIADALSRATVELLDAGNPFGLLFGLHGRPDTHVGQL